MGAAYFKGHGLGNDYIAMDGRGSFALSPPAVRLICDRHRGVGADGILVRVPAEGADFGVRIFNPDGGEAEKSGNGLRIFAAYLYEQNAVRVGEPFTVQTLGGFVRMLILEATQDGVLTVQVEMGRASFRSSAVGLVGPDREVVGEILELEDGDRVSIRTVSIGNPHCVVFADELVVEDLRRKGPRISTHPWFERGTNVQFARVAGPGEVEALVWERGAGETLASGSSACAVAAAAVRAGMVQERDVRVVMPGGVLTVSVGDDWDLRLTGPVESVFRAEPTLGLQRRLRELT